MKTIIVSPSQIHAATTGAVRCERGERFTHLHYTDGSSEMCKTRELPDLRWESDNWIAIVSAIQSLRNPPLAQQVPAQPLYAGADMPCPKCGNYTNGVKQKCTCDVKSQTTCQECGNWLPGHATGAGDICTCANKPTQRIPDVTETWPSHCRHDVPIDQPCAKCAASNLALATPPPKSWDKRDDKFWDGPPIGNSMPICSHGIPLGACGVCRPGCKAMSFPCTINIDTLAGLTEACEACKPDMPRARVSLGWLPLTGESKGFWMSTNIHPDAWNSVLTRILSRSTPATHYPLDTSHGWAYLTMQMINKLTPDIKGKAFDPDWFQLFVRLEEAERKMEGK